MHSVSLFHLNIVTLPRPKPTFLLVLVLYLLQSIKHTLTTLTFPSNSSLFLNIRWKLWLLNQCFVADSISLRLDTLGHHFIHLSLIWQMMQRFGSCDRQDYRLSVSDLFVHVCVAVHACMHVCVLVCKWERNLRTCVIIDVHVHLQLSCVTTQVMFSYQLF